jgi:hypothetical protein
MNIFDIMRLRSDWEEIVSFRKTYDLPHYESNIDNLYYFIQHGAKKNRFRKNFEEAMAIAKTIVEYYENEKTNLSSVSWEEVEAV